MEYTSDYDKYFINYALQPEGCAFDWLQYKAQGATESSLNPKARGAAGEIGIMQIMPATGEWLGYTEAQLFDPGLNIKCGIEYMVRHWRQWLGPIFDQDEVWYFCLASYNAGPGNIEKAFVKAKTEKMEYRDWSVVGGLYLPGITGRHAKTTLNYIAKTKFHYRNLKKILN